MSRTYRRKNYELTRNDSWERAGRKTNGYYTEVDRTWVMSEGRQAQLRPVDIYRAMTPQERFSKWHKDHGETPHQNDRSPSTRRYSRPDNRILRALARQAIRKWMLNEEREPFLAKRHRYTHSDWRRDY